MKTSAEMTSIVSDDDDADSASRCGLFVMLHFIQVLVLYIVCFWALCLYRYQSVNFFVPVMKQGVKRLVLLYVTVWLFVRLTLFKITGHVLCCTVLNNGTK